MKLKFQKANADQLEAINSTNGPLLIIAGPGTGKTWYILMYIQLYKQIRGCKKT